MSDEQFNLFTDTKQTSSPLAHRVRPLTVDHFFGQEKTLHKIDKLNLTNLPHIIFWGPPGCGKTTIAKILAKMAKYEFYTFNAVLGGVNDLRKIIKECLSTKETTGSKSIIFIDEIHRFNKGQQDALLPYLESGDFILLGATTESPNTSLNKAILSRVQCWPLNPLDESAIATLIQHTSETEDLALDPEVSKFLVKHSNGDARSTLNQLETLIINKEKIRELTPKQIIKDYLFSQRRYDKNQDRHYDVISAFIKSVRGSDANAAILWLAVMLDGGEDIEFIARRLIVLASEDVGNADPRALQVATSAHYGIKNIGMPEARIILAQATTYLANAPKSNASYLAIDRALEFIKENSTVEVPTHLRNHHPDKKKYKYSHSFENHWVSQIYEKTQETFYESSKLGYEKMQDDYLNRIKN
ncbi:MAG: replication-associated recombination protein A [Halobacteriovoraceae bacterium]|jgi:putative ATPase|nr:replication-associated recombination protein A [Halobacteriovoraceae bacterium]